MISYGTRVRTEPAPAASQQDRSTVTLPEHAGSIIAEPPPEAQNYGRLRTTLTV